MGLTTYVFLLFGISIAFFFLGFSPPLLSALGCDTTLDTCTPSQTLSNQVLSSIFNSLSNNAAALGLIGGAAIVSGLLLGGSFVIMYVGPILIFMAVANLVLLPTDFLYTNALPIEIRMIVLGFLNLLLVLIIVAFIRGGE